MNSFLKFVGITALLFQTSTAMASGFHYQVAAKGVRSAPSRPSAQPSGAGVEVVAWGSNPRGCYFNGGPAYMPLFEDGPDMTLCQSFLGQYVYNDVFSDKTSNPGVLLNSHQPGIDVGYPIQSSTVGRRGACNITLNNPEGGITGFSLSAFVSSADMDMCLNNQAVGKWVATNLSNQLTAVPIADLVHPVPGLQSRITSSSPGAGCMISFGPEPTKYRVVPNYIEDGADICQPSVPVYYRASDQSIHSKP